MRVGKKNITVKIGKKKDDTVQRQQESLEIPQKVTNTSIENQTFMQEQQILEEIHGLENLESGLLAIGPSYNDLVVETKREVNPSNISLVGDFPEKNRIHKIMKIVK